MVDKWPTDQKNRQLPSLVFKKVCKIKTMKVQQDMDFFGTSRTLVPGRKTVVFIVYFLEHLKPSQTLVTLKGKKGRDTGRY